MRKVGAIGVLILLGFIFNAVSVFTDSWLVWSYAKIQVTRGIVPYSSSEPTWLAAASWMMFISFGLFFPVILIYLHASHKVYHHGCCHSIRHNFNGISLLCSLIVILQAVAFILMAANASDYYGSLGYSAYFALVSGILTTIAMSLSGHVSRHDCH
ncbi:Transmembrane protein 225 [Caenorhabditis elegans]|uniref:Transmembrane protein 225 n=1 Tax=Caenorhabditis elegans TaxID=6239 RepID=Q9TZ35_CAEEL|nr:Transmembrane protein 225 [Caenorhabditis elegans]CCD69958.1 Transmembrane protein 225 [Caenorhabditis elegans]|eukprot:NP_497282.2 Uncharacterized protein CELE_T24C4.4 [Caenorhabditis elegans]